MTQGGTNHPASKNNNPVIVAAWIGAAALIVAALLTPLGSWVLDKLKDKKEPPKVTTVPTPTDAPVPKKMKKGFCNDPRTQQPYFFEVQPFYPQHYTHMDEVFGGDAVNPGHKFYLPDPVEVPGPVLPPPYTHCRHDGTHEEITYCGPLRTAKGQPTDFAEIEGWINGQGGLTFMTVEYQMECDIPGDSN